MLRSEDKANTFDGEDNEDEEDVDLPVLSDRAGPVGVQ
jgi:hypothetical protein